MERGELNELLADVKLVEFDADFHTSALSRAGYSVELIPVIAVPQPDGRGSGRQLSGSIKGADSVQLDLAPRLTALLEGKRFE